MNNIVKVGWSGGKDSTCSVLLHLERGDTVKAVCYIPMFTNEIPLIGKSHYEFILNTATRFLNMGASVNIVTGMTYCEYVRHRAKSGKYKGQIFGFPCIGRGQCGFKRDSKLKSVYSCNVGDFDYEDIGIAADEMDRRSQLNEKKRSILCEMGFTERDAFSYCSERGFLSPHYQTNTRDGCSLCPHAKENERQQWYSDYPNAVPILWELQNFVKSERDDRIPLRDHKWFLYGGDNE